VDDDPTARSRREWATWSAHNYAKTHQPRSVLRLGLAVSLAVVAIVIALMWIASH
jgi:membrane carboxypeptidase/penicillin-binding protein